MAAFPGTLEIQDGYKRVVVKRDMYKDVRTEDFAVLPFQERQVVAHASVPRTKSSPRYLPHYYHTWTVSHGYNSTSSDYGHFGFLYHGESYSVQGYVSPPLTWDWSSKELLYPAPEESLRNKCLERILGQLKQDQANYAVDAFEARQTIKLVRTLTSVKRMAEEFRRAMVGSKRHRSNNRRRAEYLRDQWMQTRYGVRPLMGTVFDTLKALLNNHVNRTVTVTSRASNIADHTLSRGYGTHWDPYMVFQTHCSTRALMKATFSLKDTGPQVQDFLSLNPASWLWETLPLSFVADWFFTVGKTLENWEDWFRYRDQFVLGMISYTTLELRSFSHKGISSQPYQYDASGNLQDYIFRTTVDGSHLCRVVVHRREVLTSLPTPQGVTSNVNLNSAKVLDLCAIISQTLKSTR